MKLESIQTSAIIWPSVSDWRLALRVLLIIFTGMIALAMAGSFFPYEQVVAHGHPWLPRFHCPGCMFCGMTRSFCALSSGRWQEAWQWNRGGPILYVSGWAWLLGATAVIAKSVREKLSRANGF
jgi:hypothetical protein